MKIATAGILIRDKNIFIARREKDTLWEFPGGRIDPGETPEACVVREFEEEFKLVVRCAEPLMIIEGFFRYTDMKVHVFFLEYISGEIELDVHTETQWISLADINDLTFVDEDREIIKPLQEYLMNRSSSEKKL